jgi:hypothetical protein
MSAVSVDLLLPQGSEDPYGDEPGQVMYADESDGGLPGNSVTSIIFTQRSDA